MTERRKRFPAYFLPADSEARFEDLPGNSQIEIFTATWYSSASELLDNSEATDGDTIGNVCHGGPILVQCRELGKTWVLLSDQSERTLVVRCVKALPDEEGFVDRLYAEDKMPRYYQATTVHKITSDHIQPGSELVALRIHRLPDNSLAPKRAIIRGLTFRHECLIKMEFKNGSELLFGYRTMGDGRWSDAWPLHLQAYRRFSESDW